MTINWFRHYHGTATDQQLSFIAKKAGAKRCEMTAFWDCLLEHASQNESRGFVGDIDLELISFSQDVTLETLQALHALLVTKGKIIDGYLSAWEKRQKHHVTKSSNERVKKWRQKTKEKQTDNDDDKNVTRYNNKNNGDVTQCNTETSLDLDTDKSSLEVDLFHKSPSAGNPKNKLKKINSKNKIIFDWEAKIFLNTEPYREMWQKAYPAVDLDAELAKAAVWQDANPKNRKSNYEKFFNNWLSKAQDRAPRAITGGVNGAVPVLSFSDQRRQRTASAVEEARMKLCGPTQTQ